MIGRLSWASKNRPPENGDWAGCAAALRAHGLPRGELLPGDSADPTRSVRIDGRAESFGDDDLVEVSIAPDTESD